MCLFFIILANYITCCRSKPIEDKEMIEYLKAKVSLYDCQNYEGDIVDRVASFNYKGHFEEAFAYENWSSRAMYCIAVVSRLEPFFETWLCQKKISKDDFYPYCKKLG